MSTELWGKQKVKIVIFCATIGVPTGVADNVTLNVEFEYSKNIDFKSLSLTILDSSRAFMNNHISKLHCRKRPLRARCAIIKKFHKIDQLW